MSSTPDEKRRKVEDNEGAESMSIEETNALRAKLGLAPLETGTETRDDGQIMGADGTAFKHTPAESITDKKKSEKLKQKIEERRAKRAIDDRLKKVKGLGESDSDEDDVQKWVQKSRKLEKRAAKRKEAELRRKDQEEQEEARRIIEEERKIKAYQGNALAGMTVRHDLENFTEGKDVILTLDDARILDEESGQAEKDVLINVNMVDNERAKKFISDTKKSKNKSDYNPLEKFDEEDEFGGFKEKKTLSKYDEVIDEKHGQKRFKIGQDGAIDTTMVDIRRQIKADMTANSISLKTDLKLSSDFYTAEEVKGFKKRKRKVKKTRTKGGMVLMDDVLERRDFSAPIGSADNGSKKDHGSRSWKRDGVDSGLNKDEVIKDEPMSDEEMISNEKIEDSLKKDVVVNSSLERTRRLLKSRVSVEMNRQDPAVKLRERLKKISEMKEKAEAEKLKTESTEFKQEIVLNDVDEFCRAVGQANAEKQYEAERSKVEIEREEREAKVKKEKEIDLDVEEEYRKLKAQRMGIKIKSVKEESEKGVEREPLANSGLAGALKVASQKGYIEKDVKKTINVDQKHKERISALAYSIEDKNRVDHLDKYAADKYRKDRREKTSNLVAFCEKDDYKPLVTIEYVDEIGRPKTEKEAFRDLSHRFHGKGSGKMKQEKRAKRLQEESALQMMSSTDTPLNTVEMLRRKQQQTKSPFINLTGGSMLSAESKK